MASCLLPLLLLATVGESDLNLLYFTASWCQPCAQMQPTLERLHAEGVTVQIVDADQHPQAIRAYQIKDLPTLVFVTRGQEVDRMVGVADYGLVKERVERALARVRGSAPRQSAELSSPAPRNSPPAATRNELVVRGQSPALTAVTSAVTAHAVTARALSAEPAPARTPSQSQVSPARPPSSLSPEQAVARASAATVRIRVDEGNTTAHGTGTIVDVHGPEALVLTCGHLFRDMQTGSQISVDLFAGTPNEVNLPAQLVDFRADETDIGLISFRLPVAVEPVELLPRSEQPQAGQVAFSFGCDHGANPTRRDTRITNINRYLGAANIEIEGAPAVGRSGGGLFDLQGRLIGVCNAADANDDRGIYAGAEVVYAQIERLNLTHLFQPPSAPQAAQSQAQLVGHAQPATGPAGATNSQLSNSQTTSTAPQWPDMQLSAESLPNAAAAPSRELIFIVRDETGERVVTIENPSPELLQQLQAHR